MRFARSWVVLAVLVACVVGCQSGPARRANHPPLGGGVDGGGLELAQVMAPVERAAGASLSVAEALTRIALFPF